MVLDGRRRHRSRFGRINQPSNGVLVKRMVRRIGHLNLGLWLITVGLLACDGETVACSPTTMDMASVTDQSVLDSIVETADLGDRAFDARFPTDSGVLVDAQTELSPIMDIHVLLDGEPAVNTLVVQGGTNRRWRTDLDGIARVDLDLEIIGELRVIASHPEARVRGEEIYLGQEQPVVIDLRRFDTSDNEDYDFQDPGEPRRRNSTAQCGHCHLTINDAWFESQHRTSASNPRVHDLYAGVATNVNNEAACEASGGRWRMGLEPGTGANIMRCYIGYGALPDLNENCGEDESCDGRATNFGGCADCHAPAINGRLGGRDLLEAGGIAYDYGVSCNVCHQVESVDPDGAPGVAGRLRILRPSEPASITLGAGGWLPLTFGPSHDSPNPRMGSVQRNHYRNSEICSGCHQHEAAPSMTPEALDRERWPSGKLPFQTTYAEWQEGALGEATHCQSCHMPPEPQVSNSADLQAFPAAMVGIQGGWLRPPGSVRQHSWLGPRSRSSRMLQLAAGVFVRKGEVRDGRFDVEVDVQNAACGHGLPTGEPMRTVLLEVKAYCGDAVLDAVAGDTVPYFGGYAARKLAQEDWRLWPGADVGDHVRVVSRSGDWHEYDGYGPFAAGRFTPDEKGLPVEHVVGHAVITAVNRDRVSFDRPLPLGDVAYRISVDALERVQAGQAGFAFARVLADAAGNHMVPHHRAIDVVSDNRLMPQQKWTSQHSFESNCDTPTVRARLLYRAFPLELAKERRWNRPDALMTEAER